MTVITLRPSSTVDNDGVSFNGASAHATVNDNSDSTYLSAFGLGDSIRFALDDITVPAGAIVKAIAARLRCASGSTSSNDLSVYLTYGLGLIVTRNITINWQTLTTITIPLLADATAVSDSAIDGANLGIESPAGHAAQALIHEVYVDVTTVAKPVTAPASPTGTITDTNLATVTWANTLDSDGGAQTQYQIRVFTSAQYGAGGFNPASSGALYDSGAFGAATSHAITTPLADGAYRAYVRVAQTVNGVTHWSDYAYTAFTIDVDLPALPDTPTLTVEDGRIKIHVEGNAGGAATTTHLEVQRSEDAATWEPVRLTTDTAGLIAGTSADVYDYEAPNGTLMTYRVRALHEISAGNLVASAWATTATAVWIDDAWWLKCPERPALNMMVYPAGRPTHQRPARQGVFQALGSSVTVIVADTRGAARGILKLQVDTAAEQAALDALLDSGLTLLLQAPTAHHWTDRYIRLGDQDRVPWIDKAWIGERFDTLQWWEVARPPGAVDSWPA